MDNLRENFKNWLIQQGISDKLINGKSSTVYEYVRQLDVLSKKLYSSDDWNLLVNNAITLAFFYLLCGKEKYRNNNYPFDKLQKYVKQNNKDILPLPIWSEFAKYKLQEKSLLQILNNKNFNEKARVSFIKFYQFIYEEKKLLNISIQDIKCATTQIIKILTIIKLNPISASFPANIDTSSQNMSQTVTIEELTNFLECSRSTIERLLKKGLFELTTDSVNAYLKEHYHPSVLVALYKPNFLHEKWYSIAEAAEFLGCSQTTVKRLIKKNLVSYTNYSSRKIKILGHDLNFFKKNNQ